MNENVIFAFYFLETNTVYPIMLAIDGRRHLSLHYCFVHRTFSIARPTIRCNSFLSFSPAFFVRRPRRQQANEVSALVNPGLYPILKSNP
nr:MAG TPA: hypothetical protein [Caudoviricetes sp.]